MDWVPAMSRWLHFLSGVMWIGLLYYFNFVQAAALKAATADGTAASHHAHCCSSDGPPSLPGSPVPPCLAISLFLRSRCRRAWPASAWAPGSGLSC